MTRMMMDGGKSPNKLFEKSSFVVVVCDTRRGNYAMSCYLFSQLVFSRNTLAYKN